MTPRAQRVKRIRGLYVLVGSSDEDPERVGAQVLQGGGRLLQLRCKGWPAEEVIRLGRALVARCEAVGATLILNDSPQLAVACLAHGVHLGQTDGEIAEARALLGPDRLIGRSTHDPAQVTQAVEQADYLAFGPIYDTPHLSRPKAVRGLDALREVRALVPPTVPLVAIGGIERARLPEVRAAGADAWAVIRAVTEADDPVQATRALL